MNPIAIYSGSTVLYWSSVIIVFGLLACLMLSLSLQRVNGGGSAAMLLFFPLAIILSVPICRVIHWYCHFEQYNGIWGRADGLLHRQLLPARRAARRVACRAYCEKAGL